MAIESGFPRVSVIIPTYNRERYIGATLESVFSQTYRNFEVIVVDDGSTDRTAEVIEPHRRRIVYIRKKNGGPASARNIGIQKSQGEYIAFLDSDDVWLPDKLAIQVEYMTAHPAAGMSFTDASVFSEDGSSQSMEIQPLAFKRDELSFKGLFRRNFIPNLTVMARASCLKSVGPFNENRDLIGGEDYEMWLRIAMHYPLGHIPKVLARYRKNADGLLSLDLLRGYAMHLRVIHVLLTKYPDLPEKFEISLNDYYSEFYYRSGRNLYRQGIYGEARRHLKMALSFYPLAPKAVLYCLLSGIGEFKHRLLSGA